MLDSLLSIKAAGQQIVVLVRDLSNRAPGSLTSQALAVGTVVGLLTYMVNKKRYHLPRGPFAWPLLGNLMSMMSKTESFYVTLDRWAREKYGPVVLVYIGPLRCVTLNNTDVAIEALVTKGDDFAGRPYLFSVDAITEGSKDIAFASYSPVWKLHRKIAMQGLKHYMSGKHLEGAVHQAVAMICEKIEAEPGAFCPYKYNMALMFHIIDSICFGVFKPFGDPELNGVMDLFDKINDTFGNGFWEDIIPPLRYWPTKKWQTVKAGIDSFLEYLYKNIDEHRKSFSADNVRDLTDSVLLAQREIEQEEKPELMAMFTNTHVGQTMSDMFAAGIDTSRYTLDWALLFMAGNPKIQKRAQQEIDSVTGSRMPGVGDKAELQYTQAVLNETLRLGTIVPTAVHRTLCDTTVGGYDVPKDTMVLINQWAMLHEPEKWENPEEFRPERYLDDQGNLKKLTSHWTPFAAGRRSCLGETVAKPELLLILSCLLKRFTISLPEGVAYDPSYDVNKGMGLHVPKPYKVVVRAR